MTLYHSFNNYLNRKNIEIVRSTEGESIIFKYSNLYYAFLYDVDDPCYFRLILPRIANYNEIDENVINKYALEKSAEYKIGKLVVINNEFWASFEQIILNADAENDYIYDKALRILSTLQKNLTDYIRNTRATQE